MQKQAITFPGSQGPLAGLLEQPDQVSQATPGQVTVLFAHCFTCGKEALAAAHISGALVQLGYAVLRFDFTGLGGSAGEFANSNFSSNVEDLVAAADYLAEHHQAPQLLIGHSLGGAAVLKAASQIPSAQAVVTIGAPANAKHVKGLLGGDLDTIASEGHAAVQLGGRQFTIKQQFIDDLEQQGTEHISQLHKALLVMHSPVDEIVAIDEAEKIYVAAKHPKSFISLDQANHLLTRREDANYAAQVIAAWSEKFIDSEDQTGSQADLPDKVQVAEGQVRVAEIDHHFQCDVQTASHQWVADEPTRVGGTNQGPDPYQHLLAALGACTVMTLRMYADKKQIPMDQVVVTLSHSREHGEDCQACDETHPRVDVIERTISFEGELSQDDRDRLLLIADKCPVHRTLHNKIEIRTGLAN